MWMKKDWINLLEKCTFCNHMKQNEFSKSFISKVSVEIFRKIRKYVTRKEKKLALKETFIVSLIPLRLQRKPTDAMK